MDLNQTKPKLRPRSKTNEKTLRGRPVWVDETGEITGKKGTRYSEVSTTIPFGTGWITAPTIDESGNRLSDEKVKQRLKDNQGKDFITGEKLPVFSSEEKASEYAQWRSDTMFDKGAIEEGFPEETFPNLPEDKKEEKKESSTSFKGFIEYLFTPSRHFGTGQYNEGGVAEQMEMFGYTAEGAQQEADKFVGEAGNLEEDISKAASFVVPFYDSGVNIVNVAQEYMKPEEERDYDYIKSQFTEAGQSAAIEGGLLLMGGVAGKYGAKGIKALADKVKQYEINPTAMSAFGAGAIRKKQRFTLDDFGYKEDNPVTKGFGGSEDWLSGKIKEANKSKNLLDGATTAFLGTSKDKPLFLDTDVISSLKGARGEVRKKGEPQYDRLKKTVDKEGFDPNKTILIEVNHKGEAYIIEGNTRATLAKELGVPNIKAEIRYKNGAELVDSPFSPQNIIEKSSKISYPEALATSKKLNEEMISVFPKPERMFPEESRPKGGDYLNPATGEVLSGRNVSSAKLSISPEGKPSFKVSNDNVEEVGSVGKGKTQIKTNLFKKKAGWKWTKAPEGMEDIATLISVENRGKHFYTIETDFSKGVNLKKYPNSKTEPRLRPTVVGEIEIGPQIGNISVRGKEHPVYQSIRTFNKGGAVMDDQMKMAFMDEGGIADDGMDVDPVSGNEVPPGSLAEEVRDDIPAQLSEGEYVVPADVVRYYGVKFFEDLRDQAKMGLAEMEANGRIGGEPVPAGGPKNESLTSEEQQAVEAMMGMEQGGAVQNPYLQQQQLYNQEPSKAVGNTMGYSGGGSSAPVNQLQTQAITPTVYNQPNYSFLSPSTTTQTSQTTEQAINQATQNAFTPVMMRSPEGVEAEAKTREQMKKWLAAGWTILTGAQTTTTTTEETTTTPTDTTITPTTPTRTGGGGTNITVGNKSGTGGFGFGFKNWGEKVDWSNPDSIKTFVENSTQGLLDPGTGKKITEVGFGIAGPVGGALGAAASTVPSLGSLSDLRASRFILQAQGMETDFVDAQIKKITDNASGFTNFIDNVFKEVADGDAKARAALDRLRLEYTRDEKTGDPIFSDEQKIANRAKLKKPATDGNAAPGPSGGRGTIYEKPGDREAAIKPVGSGRGTIYEKPGDRQEAARKAAAERRKKKDKKFFSSQSGKKSITSAEKKKLDTRKSKATKGYKGGRAEGGLMNKKGNK